jgi:ribosomal protein S18 acetylase RimI-like enzyme
LSQKDSSTSHTPGTLQSFELIAKNESIDIKSIRNKFCEIMIQVNDFYKLTHDDIEKGSEVLRNAFIDYPTFRYLFPDLNEREKKLRQIMRFFLKCGLIHGNVIAPSKDIEGISIWYKSKDLNFSLGSLLKAGLISLLLNLGTKSFNRFKRLGDTKKSNRDKIIEEEYYFLDVIGIDPSFARRGYAKLLIDSILLQVDKENMSCFLETSNIKNIDYYSRHGFDLLSKYEYDGLESFCLLRK